MEEETRTKPKAVRPCAPEAGKKGPGPVQVFISYSTEDAPAVERLGADLQLPGLCTYVDTKRMKSMKYRPELEREIDNSILVLALVSAAALAKIGADGVLEQEWQRAESAGKLVLVFLDRVQQAWLDGPAFAPYRNCTRFTLFPDYEKQRQDLLRFVMRVSGGETFRETFSCSGSADDPVTDLSSWSLDAAGWGTAGEDRSGERSRSLHGRVAPEPWSPWKPVMAPGLGPPVSPSVDAKATLSLDRGGSTRLRFWRKLHLHTVGASGFSIMQRVEAKSTFRVTVSDGDSEITDQVVAPTGAPLEEQWTCRQVDLTTLGRRQINITFEVSASDPSTRNSVAEAWVDDIVLDEPEN